MPVPEKSAHQLLSLNVIIHRRLRVNRHLTAILPLKTVVNDKKLIRYNPGPSVSSMVTSVHCFVARPNFLMI